MIEVWVTDAGRGLRSQEIGRVFDAFFTTKSNGMGMGLPISRTIIEAHGGRIWAENNAHGPGATFRFTLPAATGGSAMNEISPPAVL
jgi:two-component system sensor kinase FixL